MPQIYAKVDEHVPELVEALGALSAKLPKGQYYKYSDLFFRSIQNAAFVVVLRRFLEHEDVVTKEQVAQQLGCLFHPPLCTSTAKG